MDLACAVRVAGDRKQRGTHRSEEMTKLAEDTFGILATCVVDEIKDLRREAFRLVTGKLDASPFSPEALASVREKLFSLLADPQDAAKIDEGQPFYLSSTCAMAP